MIDEEKSSADERKEDEPPKVAIDVDEEILDKSTKGDVPKCPSPYPQRVIMKKEDYHFNTFVDQLSKLSVNIPLSDALLQMLGYSKFMKEMLQK